MEFVYAFDEQAPGGRELLGGKGIGLAEMTALGVPVPAGFTVTTDACRVVMRSGDVPDDLWGQVETHIARLEGTSGKRFGDPLDPLLVSVRSGAAPRPRTELGDPRRRTETEPYRREDDVEGNHRDAERRPPHHPVTNRHPALLREVALDAPGEGPVAGVRLGHARAPA